MIELLTEKHLVLYNIRQIKKETKIQVIEVCGVLFSIGKIYKSDVVCDMVDADACYLLLGRPWQFNINAIHKKRDSIYEFQ